MDPYTWTCQCRTTRKNLHQLTGYTLKGLPGVIDDWNGWSERGRESGKSVQSVWLDDDDDDDDDSKSPTETLVFTKINVHYQDITLYTKRRELHSWRTNYSKIFQYNTIFLVCTNFIVGWNWQSDYFGNLSYHKSGAPQEYLTISPELLVFPSQCGNSIRKSSYIF